MLFKQVLKNLRVFRPQSVNQELQVYVQDLYKTTIFSDPRFNY